MTPIPRHEALASARLRAGSRATRSPRARAAASAGGAADFEDHSGPGRGSILSWQPHPRDRPPQGDQDATDDPAAPSDPPSVRTAAAAIPPQYQAALDDFSRRWLLGEVPDVETYLQQLPLLEPDLVVELIYREYCLAEIDQRGPDPAFYLARFPQYRPRLSKLLAVHEVDDGEPQGPGTGSPAGATVSHEAGQEIGPYLLRRELGRGASARVFLAEEMDLENRLVVVKLTTRPTLEPWLLARVSHPHIVEILSYAIVDDGDCQLICMPFLGGATLSAVLARRREEAGRGGGRGVLLRDLDTVAAPEYTGTNPASPARELLGRLSDDHALAWITARLAEGLDHASSQKVIHGDIKPSNILLAADGMPMLLDFNLAQDWSPRDSSRPPEDPGGTLAYMPPERLREIALARSAPCPAGAALRANPSDEASHRGDIYALGMVLLEAITGSAPPPVRFDAPAEAAPRRSPRELASEFADFRERGASAVIGAAQAAGRRPIPPALRAVLVRCLAARPAERYGRALELAEDLNRWRAGKPLAYASEPFWTSTVARVLRQRSKLLAAAALALAVGLLTTAFLANYSRATLQALALHKLARHLDDPELPAFQVHRPGSPRLHDPEDPQVLTIAIRALKDYDVLGNRDWRQVPEFQNLPREDRADLELFLMEQALRFCKPLADRARSPHDRQWALVLLDNLETDPPLRALAELRLRLARDPEPSPRRTSVRETPADRVPRPAPISPALDDYLLGVSAELENGAALQGTDRALAHYQAVLRRSPDSFWAHYRSAVVCFSLKRWSEAANHLEECVRRRPRNAILHGQLAAGLTKAGLLDRAVDECDRALELAPELGEFYRSRAFARARSGLTDGLEQDLDRFELLSRSLARTYFHSPPAQELGDPRSAAVAASRRVLDLDSSPRFVAPPDDPLLEPDRLDAQELKSRALLATTISQAGADAVREAAAPGRSANRSPKTRALALAARELDKILALEPGHVPARLVRMSQSLEEGRFAEARQDLDLALIAPDLKDLLHKDPEYARFLGIATYRLARRGLVDSAVNLGRKLVTLSGEVGLPRGQAYYYLARARAIAARSDPEQISEAAENLHYAVLAHPRFREWYRGDREFDPVRTRIDAALQRLADYATSY
jgi:serine/threonine protein kinase